MTLTVRVPGAGRITVTGAEIKNASRRVGKAGSYRLTVRLTARAIKRLKARRQLRISAKVAYRPASGRAQTATVAVELKASR